MSKKQKRKCASRSATLTIPELEQSKAAVLNTLASSQDLLNAVPQNTLRGRRDGAMLGLLLGCGLRRSEVVGLRLDQVQLRESHWVIAVLR
jgi:site-specific recombinase XerD